jgi:hypothetical protein
VSRRRAGLMLSCKKGHTFSATVICSSYHRTFYSTLTYLVMSSPSHVQIITAVLIQVKKGLRSTQTNGVKDGGSHLAMRMIRSQRDCEAEQHLIFDYAGTHSKLSRNATGDLVDLFVTYIGM